VSDAPVCFARGMKFRFDEVRKSWVLLGPERAFMPDEHAVEVLKLIDGRRTEAAIVDELARRFNAPRDEIATDVAAMLDDLSRRGAIRRS
jgi:pyrroloquinoline quinone biosynthesis protein D